MEYVAFMQEFRAVFNHPDQGRAVSLSCSCARGTIQQRIMLCFRVLAAESGWINPALLPVFWRGLTQVLQLELACRVAEMDLNKVITLAIKLD